MEKKGKKKKRKFRIFLLVIIGLLIFSFVLILLGAYVFKIPIKSVIVHGNNIVSDELILENTDLDKEQNFFLTSSRDIEDNLKQIPLVKEVKVRKNIFFEVNIYISFYKPFLVREDTDTIILENGKEIKNEDIYSLDIPYLINYVPDTKLDELIKKMNKIDYALIIKISQIKYDPTKYDEDRFILYMNDSNRVYINLPKFKNFNKYEEMVSKFEGKTGILYLDSGNYFEIDK